MATKKAYDLAVVVGHYTDSTGTDKSRYQNIGVVLQKDDGGKFIILDRSFNPAGIPYDASNGNTVLVSMFEPKGDGQQDTTRTGREEPRRQSPYAPDGSPNKPAAPEQPGFEDDLIPF